MRAFVLRAPDWEEAEERTLEGAELDELWIGRVCR